eukprot:m.10262 g.10262  ORF g.10262 m.10262 type:complete len:183 (+) comp8214_c0_seq1:208-756(+)
MKVVKYIMMAAVGAFTAHITHHHPQTLQPTSEHDSILFFDGVCNLCDGAVNFVADNDSKERVRFGAIQKNKDRLIHFGAGKYAEGGEEELSTVVLIQDGQVYTHSTAVFRVVALLDHPLHFLSVLSLIPESVRDFGYSVVAKHRYAVFGSVDSCRAPSDAFKSRFIDNDLTDDGKVPKLYLD